MKKPVKVLLIVLLVVLVIVGTIPLWLDHFAKAALESGGSSALGVPTTIESVTLRPVFGYCKLAGVRVDNPPGYKSPFFTRIGKCETEVDLDSVMGDRVEIPTLTLEDIEVFLDRSNDDANYEVILANLKKLEGEPAPPDAKKKSFIIREVVLRNIRVEAQLSLAGVLKPKVPLVIEEIRLTDLGEEGVPMSRVFGKIMGGLLRGIAEGGAGVLPKEIAGGLTKGVGALGKGAVKVVGAAGKTITEGIGKLFGK